jgi:hypothetical protein
MSLARELARHGMRSLVFEYDDMSKADAETIAAAGVLRAAGARHIALICASLGGRAAVQAAARDHGTLAAAISLSAEWPARPRNDPRLPRSQRPIARRARRQATGPPSLRWNDAPARPARP